MSTLRLRSLLSYQVGNSQAVIFKHVKKIAIFQDTSASEFRLENQRAGETRFTEMEEDGTRWSQTEQSLVSDRTQEMTANVCLIQNCATGITEKSVLAASPFISLVNSWAVSGTSLRCL